jgi:hypothetical protein
VEVPELAHLVRVRPVAVLSRHLQDRRQVLQARVRKEDAELLAQHAFADVRVAIPVRAEVGCSVVDVQHS